MLECKALAVSKCLEHGRCVFSSPQHMARLLGIEDDVSNEVLFEWQNLHYFVKPTSIPTAGSGSQPSSMMRSYWGVLTSSVRWTVAQAVSWSCWLGQGFHKATIARFSRHRAASAAASSGADHDEEEDGREGGLDAANAAVPADQVLFLPALHRMCSVLLEDLDEMTAYNSIWTLEDWTDFIFDHKFRNGEVITSQMILNGALTIVGSATGESFEALAVKCIGPDSDVRRIVDWKLMVERIDLHVRQWESELQDLRDLKEGDSPQGRRFERLVATNKLVHIQTQKLHKQLQVATSEQLETLHAAIERVDMMMENFPGVWPNCEDADAVGGCQC
jgi:hypothetical protein